MNSPCVFVLLLESNKFYVEFTKGNIQKRIEQHLNGEGTAWTRMYAPIEIVSIEAGTKEDERKKATELMMKHGWENVRDSEDLDFSEYTSEILRDFIDSFNCVDKLPQFFYKHYGNEMILTRDKNYYYYDHNNKIWLRTKNMQIYLFSKYKENLEIYIKYLTSLIEYRSKAKTEEKQLRLAKRSVKYNELFMRTIFNFMIEELNKNINQRNEYMNKYKSLNCSYDLLPIANGKIIELRTKNIRDRQSEDYFTYYINREYKSVYSDKMFRYLETVFTICDYNKLQIIQAFLGYSLLGENAKKYLFVLEGKGSNGKSTFVSIIKSLLGDDVIQNQTFATKSQRISVLEDPSNNFNELDIKRLTNNNLVSWVVCNGYSNFNDLVAKPTVTNKIIKIDFKKLFDEINRDIKKELIEDTTAMDYLFKFIVDGIKLYFDNEKTIFECETLQL